MKYLSENVFEQKILQFPKNQKKKIFVHFHIDQQNSGLCSILLFAQLS
mgnify:CR=1 FL=1